MPSMNASHVNVFIDATKETLTQMCGMSFYRDGKIKKVDGQIVESDDLLTVIGLSGESLKGAVMIAAPLDVGKKIVGAFLMEDITEINTDLMDGFGEIVNILAGAADAKMNKHHFDLSLPSILVGKNTKFFAKAGTPFVLIPLKIDNVGTFQLGLSLDIKS